VKKLINNILPIFKDRVFFIFVFVLLMFAVVTLQYYRLQIIEHNKYANDLRASVERQIEIPATRGLIFDRYGRPLAINKPTNVIKFDQQVKMRQDEVNRNKDQLNQVLLDVANIILGNNDKYIDNIPISEKPPFVFTGSETEIRAIRWQKKIQVNIMALPHLI
jgi:penicillin-binding protein 2